MTDPKTATPIGGGSDHEFRQDVERMGEYVGQLHDDIAGLAKTAGEAAHSGVAAVKESGRQGLRAARARGEEASASVRSTMTNNPGATLGVALGVGVLLGLLVPAIARAMRDPS